MKEAWRRHPGARRAGRGRVWAAGAALLLFLLFLSLDQAGRLCWVSSGRHTQLGVAAELAIDAPPGRYELLVRVSLRDGLDWLGCQAGGWNRRTTDIPPTKRAVRQVSMGHVAHSGGVLNVELSSAPGRGEIVEVVLLPSLPGGIPWDATQRIVAGLAIAFAVSTLGGPRKARPALAVLGIVSLLNARMLLFGLGPEAIGDRLGYFFPVYELLRRALLHGVLPLWNPHVSLGTPGVANLQAQMLYVPNLVLGLLRLSFARRDLWMRVVHELVAGFGMAYLARRVRLSSAAATVCAIAFVLSPAIHNQEHLTILCTNAWLPWTLALVLPEASAWGFVASLALAFSAGHLQYFSYIVLALLLTVVRPPVRVARAVLLSRLVRLSALAALLCAAGALPFVELATMSTRGRGLDPRHASLGALRPRQLWGMLDTGIGARFVPVMPTTRGAEALGLGLLGTPLIVAAALGARRRRRRLLLAWLATLVVGSLLFAFGNIGAWSPYAILSRVPPWSGQRVPARCLVLAQGALCLLAGVGLQELAVRTRRLCPGRAWAVSALLATAFAMERFDDAWTARSGCDATIFWPGPALSPAPTPGLRELAPRESLANHAMVTGRLAAFGYDPLKLRRTALLWNVAYPGLYEFNAAGQLLTVAPRLIERELLEPHAITTLGLMGVSTVELVGRPSGLVDVRPPRGRRWAVRLADGSRATLYGRVRPVASRADAVHAMTSPGLLGGRTETFSGVGAIQLQPRTEEAVCGMEVRSFLTRARGLSQGTEIGRVTAYAGARVVGQLALRAGVETSDASLAGMAEQDAAAHVEARPVFRLAVTWEKKRIVGEVYRASVEWPTCEAVNRVVFERTLPGDFDARLVDVILHDEGWSASGADDQAQRIVVEGDTGSASGPAARVPLGVIDRGLGRVDVTLPAHHFAGTVVLADAYAPGWTARVDGAPAPILPAAIALRAVQVGAGAHTVEFRYRPFSFALGLFSSLMTCLALALSTTTGARVDHFTRRRGACASPDRRDRTTTGDRT